MTTKARRSPPDLTEDEITRTLEAGIENADKERARGFEGLRLLRVARIRGRERQLRKLGRTTGGPQGEGVQAVAAKLDGDLRLERAFSIEAAHAVHPTLAPVPEAWILHGHVLHESLDPAPNVLVALASLQGEAIKAGWGRTDPSGYFKLSLRVPPEESAKVPGPERGGARRASRQAVREGPLQVIVRVLAGRSRVLFEEDAPVVPVGGGVEYTEIVLPEESKPSRRAGSSIPRSGGGGPTPRPPRKAR